MISTIIWATFALIAGLVGGYKAGKNNTLKKVEADINTADAKLLTDVKGWWAKLKTII